MKQSQWTLALVLLAVMVFGVTFALQYLGDPRSNPAKGDTPAGSQELTFGMKHFPPGDQPIELEQGGDGSCDFWFVNENDRPMGVWLNKTGCKCSEVLVFLTSPEWRQRRSALLAAQLLASSDLWSGLGLVMGAEQDPELHRLEGQAKGEPISDKVVQVPRKGVGWVRLTWKGEKQGATATKFWGELWMDQKGAGPIARLEAGVRFLPPLRVAGNSTDRKLGNLNPRSLPHEESIVYWSSTRPSLDVEVKMVRLRTQPGTDPFQVGQPQPLTDTERERLQQEVKDAAEPGKVRCAYRVPVAIRDRADDTAQVDTGPFRRQVELKLKGQDDPVTVTMTGAVQGDVRVGGNPGEEGHVRFLTFSTSKGKLKSIQLFSETPGITLALDEKRTAPFLDVVINPPEIGAGGLHTWNLDVRIPPGGLVGKFPRDDDPAFRDTAVYLKVLPAGRTIRIPVDGIADLQ